MALSEGNILESIADSLKLFIIQIGFDLIEILVKEEGTDEPEGECFSKNRRNVIFEDVSCHQRICVFT